MALPLFGAFILLQHILSITRAFFLNQVLRLTTPCLHIHLGCKEPHNPTGFKTMLGVSIAGKVSCPEENSYKMDRKSNSETD